jgi:hypothetical protein
MKNIITFITLLGILNTSFCQKNDFTNQLYKGTVKLDNVRFSLSLSKIIINGEVPEVLDTSSLVILRTNYLKFDKTTKASNVFSNTTFSDFNSRLPQVEILRSKLVTFKYPTGKEESLLLNSIKSEKTSIGKLILTLLFQSENTSETNNEDDVYVDEISNRKEINPLEWNLVATPDDVFLKLEIVHLERLGLKNSFSKPFLISLTPEGDVFDSFQSTMNDVNRSVFSGDIISSGKSLYFGKKPDNYFQKNENYYLDPESLSFLFKLTPVSN